MRISQTLPKWVFKMTMGRTGKTVRKGLPLMSTAPIRRSAMLQAINAAMPMPNALPQTGQDFFLRGNPAAAAASRTQRRQARVPMHKVRKISSNHAGMAWNKFSHRSFISSFDREDIVSHGPVRVPRHDVPDHAISPRWQRRQAYFQKRGVGGVYVPIPLVHHSAVSRYGP